MGCASQVHGRRPVLVPLARSGARPAWLGEDVGSGAVPGRHGLGLLAAEAQLWAPPQGPRYAWAPGLGRDPVTFSPAGGWQPAAGIAPGRSPAATPGPLRRDHPAAQLAERPSCETPLRQNGVQPMGWARSDQSLGRSERTRPPCQVPSPLVITQQARRGWAKSGGNARLQRFLKVPASSADWLRSDLANPEPRCYPVPSLAPCWAIAFLPQHCPATDQGHRLLSGWRVVGLLGSGYARGSQARRSGGLQRRLASRRCA
jgi:hypothetical protein